MEPASGSARGRWGTAVALTVAVLFLSVFDAIPLVALPLAVLLMALPAQRRWKWIALGAGVWALVALTSVGTLGVLARGWALLLGGGFLAATLWRPDWGVLPRALLALGAAVALGAAGLTLNAGWQEVDELIRTHFQSVASLAVGDLGARAPESAWVQELGAATQRMAELQWQLFPALLGLQSLAALALAAWWVGRLRGEPDGAFVLRPLREFRFNDQLVWILIGGLVLLALPLDALATRVGYNALLFMGALYALRGVGVFLFLAGGAPSLLTVLFGALAAIFLYPLVLTAAVLVGLGDTWLDVRGRATLAPRA